MMTLRMLMSLTTLSTLMNNDKMPVLHTYHLNDKVTAFSTTREGGVSEGLFARFNINPYCGDSAEAVQQNKAALCRKLNIDSERIILPYQTHGTTHFQVTPDFFAQTPEERQQQLEGVDAVSTSMTDVCVGVSTADCIPVSLYDEAHHAVSAIHAGWRGTVQRIVAKTLSKMETIYGTNPSDVVAVIGPGISLAHFEIGDEVYEQFREAGFDMQTIARRYEKWHIDLPECNRLQLLKAGVKHIHMSGICTWEQCDTYFSARRLGAPSGRIYTGIILRA